MKALNILTDLGRPVGITVALAGLGLAVAACGSGASPPSAAVSGSGSSSTGQADTIVIKNFAFQPATLTVAAGTKVMVKNEDGTTHTVTAENGAFDTGDVPAHSTKTFTAPKAGTYPYMCNIHQYMHGTLRVSG